MLIFYKFLLTRAHIFKYIIYSICTVLSLFVTHTFLLFITPVIFFCFVLSVANLYLEFCGWN